MSKYRFDSWAACLALILVYALAGTLIPLFGDESYYWLWGQHLEWGYLDHPPMVGWLGAAAGCLDGSSLALFRLAGLGVFCAAALGVAWVTSRASDAPRRVAGRTLLMLLAAPLLAHYAVEVGPDTPLLLAWMVALVGCYQAALAGRPRWWLVAGLGVGVAILSKLTGWLLGASVLAYVVLDPRARPNLRSPWLWAGFVGALLVALPHFAYNAGNGWENYAFQWSLRLRKAEFAPQGLSRGVEVLADLGFLTLLALPALVWALRESVRSPFIRLLLWFTLPIQLAFMVVRTLGPARWNWPMPGYLTLLALTALWLERGGPGRARAYRFAVALTILWSLTGLVVRCDPRFETALIEASRKVIPGAVVRPADAGFAMPALGLKIREMLQTRQRLLLADEYVYAASLTFYAGHEVGLIRPHSEGSQFMRWNHFEGRLGQDALVVTHKPVEELPHILGALQAAFTSFRPLEPLDIVVDPGRPPCRFYLYDCTSLKDNSNLQRGQAWRPQ